MHVRKYSSFRAGWWRRTTYNSVIQDNESILHNNLWQNSLISFHSTGFKMHRVVPLLCDSKTKVQISSLLPTTPTSSLQGQLQGGASQIPLAVLLGLTWDFLVADHPHSSQPMNNYTAQFLYSSHTHSSLDIFFLFSYTCISSWQLLSLPTIISWQKWAITGPLPYFSLCHLCASWRSAQGRTLPSGS